MANIVRLDCCPLLPKRLNGLESMIPERRLETHLMYLRFYCAFGDVFVLRYARFNMEWKELGPDLCAVSAKKRLWYLYAYAQLFCRISPDATMFYLQEFSKEMDPSRLPWKSIGLSVKAIKRLLRKTYLEKCYDMINSIGFRGGMGSYAALIMYMQAAKAHPRELGLPKRGLRGLRRRAAENERFLVNGGRYIQAGKTKRLAVPPAICPWKAIGAAAVE